MERTQPMRRADSRKPYKTAGLSIWACLLIIGGMAWLYLFQADRVSAANATLQQQHVVGAQLQQQHQESLQALGHAQSPAYILSRARALGMEPGLWGDRP
jgi:hypothetical protein